MADSQLIVELLILQTRGGCSLMVLLFFLMLVRTCCFILSARLCVARLKADFHEANCTANSPRNVTKHAPFESFAFTVSA